MRIIVLLCIAVTGLSQNPKRFPFQVFSAQNCLNNKKQVIQNQDFLKRSDKLILNSGEVYLVHYTGLSFHFTGDTTISLEYLNKKLADVPVIGRPKLEALFSEESLGSMIHDFYPTIFYPPPRNTIHNRKDDLCLRWKSDQDKDYVVKLKNAFEDTVIELRTKTNLLTVNAKQIQAMNLDLNFLQVVIESQGKPVDFIGIKIFDGEFIDSPFGCTFKDALQSLLVGYWLERSMQQKEAEEFYRLAASISTEPLFKEALSFYLKRRAN